MTNAPAIMYNGDTYVRKLKIQLDAQGEIVMNEKVYSHYEWTKIVWDRGSYEKSAKKETKKSKPKSDMIEDTVEDNGDSD